jgi:hypothetical protein
VPEGNLVKLHANVTAGSDKVANEEFKFSKSSGKTAKYTISGTTLSNSLKYDGM